MTTPVHPRPARDYAPVLASLRIEAGMSRTERMRRVCDAVWAAFGGPGSNDPARGVSWIGFYEKVADRDEMVLLERRDAPACSPIGLTGMCGRSWQTGTATIVDDIASLGEHYIACDPRDRSEVVVPLFDQAGVCWGVLDADSHDLAGFSGQDVAGLIEAVERAGLSEPGLIPREPTRL